MFDALPLLDIVESHHLKSWSAAALRHNTPEEI